VLLDDAEHTYDYVVEMLEKLFALSPADAWNHAVEVDNTGRTIVITCELPAAEFGRDQIHAFGADWRMPKQQGIHVGDRGTIIDHKDPVLKVNVSDDGAQGKQAYVLSMTTDGKEVTNNAGGLEVKNSASWEGPSLVVGTKLKFQDTDVIVRSVWVLSADGKTLTETAHLVAGALGETDQTFVFEKQ
jgi:hypothetical protein